MTLIKIKPHKEICPKGANIQAEPGETLAEVLLENGIKIEHACELSCACTTCHVVIREGFQSLNEAKEDEEDMLDKAWGLESESRLSCQVIIDKEELEIELPKYTINMVSENN
ncbi:MAG: ISC system 2Fe-2S type ferredoxin [Gammaproteobacteria bacterium]|nr:ISC system 2Fe-2S type ferredoxin [Gammaproteobacteria bacterium]HJL95548.1 ISC system 2Fe-2S type ferredoxin [SAR86 cluster bacterium]|tara:strand:- start:18131 stop:18469 length:339 start_codon:yes stop_codon:yes gene_type:complete